MSRSNHDQVKILRAKVYDLIVKENCLWQQRTRVDWLKSRDLNTSYFHSRANQQIRRNFISKLVLDNGTSVEDEQKIGEVMVDYFEPCSLQQTHQVLIPFYMALITRSLRP